MLKSFREAVLTTPHLPDPDAVRAGLWMLVRFTSFAILGGLLSRVTFASIAPACALAPFALALFAAGLSAGVNPAGLLTGCALGAINGSLETYNVALPMGCAVALGGALIWSVLDSRWARIRSARHRPPENQARSPNVDGGEARLSMVLAGLGTLLPGLFYAGGALLPSAQVTAAAVAALTAAPFLREALAAAALQWREYPMRCDVRRRAAFRNLSSEARTGAVLLALMVEAGLTALYPPGALGIGTLAIALCCPFGALTGMSLGLSTLLISQDACKAAVLGLCGGAAQLCARKRTTVRVAWISASALVLGVYLKLSAVELIGLCAGPPLALLLPESAREAVWKRMRTVEDRGGSERLAELLRADTVERLRAMSAAFGDLAESYLMPVSLPDEQALIARLREDLCQGCPGYGECWAGDRNQGARLLCELVTAAAEGDGETSIFEEGVASQVARQCRRSRAMPERIGETLDDFSRMRREELKRAGENRLISAQFLQARQLIDALAQEQSTPVQGNDRRVVRALAALERADVEVADALLLPGRRSKLIITLREGRWTARTARLASKRLTEAMGQAYAPSGPGGRTLRFVRAPKLSARVGAGSMPSMAGAPSGDSHLMAMLDEESLLVLICDGMGRGEAAQRESAQAARLLGRFLAAGADWALAIETVNAMLLNVSAEDMFSTVDMLLLNLTTGMAECVKLAACPTLIVRDGTLEQVEGGRLPLGILERVQPAASRVQLMPGDLVLMASDGVMDAVDPAALEAMLNDPGEDMNALSERVLALAQSSSVHRDDMTAVCLRVMENAA